MAVLLVNNNGGYDFLVNEWQLHLRVPESRVDGHRP